MDANPLEQPTEAPTAVATGEKARRQLPESTRRILLIVSGVFILVGSVGGFYLTSDAFDERTSVLVAAVDIEKGDVVSPDFFTSDSAVMGSIPHIPYSADAPLALNGLVATQPIPLGGVVLDHMMIRPDSGPVGNELELQVSFDTSLATSGVFDGDEVLLIDPGAQPTAENPGRAQAVLGSLLLQNYENGSMTMFLEPMDWAYWRRLPAALGGTRRILPVPIGGTVEEFGSLMDAVWLTELRQNREAAVAAPVVSGPQPGPGELEVIVSLDSSLVPSGVYEGNTVLMIDPGKLPSREDPGRARMVLRTLELENFDGSAMRLFVAPEEWVAWKTLPEELGGSPMVLPIPAGTDIDDMSQRLNAEWAAEWQLAINQANRGG